MKKAVSIALVFAMVLCFAGCGLFSDDSVVKFGETYTHNDPDGLKYDTRLVLMGDGFETSLEEFASSAAYPNTMTTDDEGNITGMYDYDPATGYAVGWTDFATGEYTAYAEGEEVDLGMPDESLMVDIPGEVSIGCVVYGNEGKAVSAYVYAFLTDAAAKQLVIDNMLNYSYLTMEEVSDTVLCGVIDEAAIADEFAAMEGYEGDTDAQAYSYILQTYYGVREYTGENAYEPYAGHTDPADIEWDERAVLTSNGKMAVQEKYENDIVSATEFIYAKDGEVVADYFYYEFSSKEAADKMASDPNVFLEEPDRPEDNVILYAITGQEMQDNLAALKGYSVINDYSLAEYVRQAEEGYYMSRYE